MTKLHAYLDAGTKGVWANIRMDNNDPCWIGIADTGVLVKKSKIGMFGAKLYDEKVTVAVNTAMGLSQRFPDELTPSDIQHPLLKAFTNAVLHCDDIGEVKRVLNNDYPEADIGQVGAFLTGEEGGKR